MKIHRGTILITKKKHAVSEKPLETWRTYSRFPFQRRVSPYTQPLGLFVTLTNDHPIRLSQGCWAPTSVQWLFFSNIFGIAGIPSRELTYPPDKAYLKIIFLFPRWDMLISSRVLESSRNFCLANHFLTQNLIFFLGKLRTGEMILPINTWKKPWDKPSSSHGILHPWWPQPWGSWGWSSNGSSNLTLLKK